MLRRAATLALAATLCGAGPHEAPARVVLQSSSDCPGAAQVREVLAPLLPSSVVATKDEAASGAATEVVILDSGRSFSVKVLDEERAFDDAGRSCAERARLAAVFIGLVLAPPLKPAAEAAVAREQQREPEPEPYTPSAAPPPEAEPAASALELSLLLQGAPQADTAEPPLAGGLGARLVHGRTLAVSVGAAAFLPTTLRFELADARIVRVPVDVSLRLSSGRSTLEGSAELGGFAALLIASGQRVDNERTELRPELGLRAALAASVELDAKIASFLSLHASVVPSPHEFRLRPDQRAGSMPGWWIGSALGIRLRP